MKILVADDDLVVQTVISTILRDAGHDVDCASGGQEALELVAQGAPACVFLDLYMDDMSGLDVLVEIREKFDKETCPVILMSAEEDQTSAGVAVDFGANDFLFKPVSAQTLLSKLEELFGTPEVAAVEPLKADESEAPLLADVSVPAVLQPGQGLGSYTIERVLRQSGDEVVYQALDGRLGRKVRIKMSPRASEEAKMLAMLSHRNIVAVYDLGYQYLVTEFVGETLAEAKCLGWSEALRWTREILRGLGALHARGLLHTRLNPHKVSLAADRHVCITDLATEPAASEAPASPYEAPELMAGEASLLTPAADLYSAAAMLHYFLEGVPPGEEGPKVAPEVEEVVRKGLQTNPSDRYQSADEFRSALGAQLRRVLASR